MLTQREKNRNFTMMVDIIKYCHKHGLFHDITFYINGECYSSEYEENATLFHLGPNSDCTFYKLENRDVTKYLEYCNPNGLTMVFEGPFYHAYNGYDQHHISTYSDINHIIEKYEMYAEQGYAWSLATYPL